MRRRVGVRGMVSCIVDREVLTLLGRVGQLTKIVYELEADGKRVRSKPC